MVDADETVTLGRGKVLAVRFTETGSNFLIAFDAMSCPGAVVVEESKQFLDNEGRWGILYCRDVEPRTKHN